MKIIAYYLPQFHTFPENEQWWGKGFTEWTNVKNAKSFFKGHLQPREPLEGYYNLLDVNTLKWQVNLAKKYGIYGFCYYHYWFDEKMLMEKPMEILFADKSIRMPFCISWANHDWTRAWGSSKKKELLLKQTYRKDKWKEHFNYLLPFFKDDRYIKIDGKPLFILYKADKIEHLKEMVALWNDLAERNGLPGIYWGYQDHSYDHTKDQNGSVFDFGIEFQPFMVRDFQYKFRPEVVFGKACNIIAKKLHLPMGKWCCICYDYDKMWKYILKSRPRDEKMIPGAFVYWDNTPRYKETGSIYLGYSSQKFEKYLSLQIKNAKKNYKKDMIFIFAWNEWGEGGYLEPDKTEKYNRLRAIKNALEENNEFPAYPE